MISDTLDGVLIDQDEDGFQLILSGERAEYSFRIHGVAAELLRAVKREIEPWWLEMQDAARGLGVEELEPGGWGDISDPKHPRHHEVMSEIHDSREGK